MILNSCEMGPGHKKRFQLLRIVNKLCDWMMFRNMLSLFVGLWQNIVPSYLLITSQDAKSFLVVF